MEKLARKLRSHWSGRELRLVPGATTAEMDAFEWQHQVQLTTRLRDFLSIVNGFVKGEWDEELIEWYPLSGWRPVGDLVILPDCDSETGAAFVFADYCLDGFLYFVWLEPKGRDDCPVYVLAGPEPSQIAASWSDLIESYLSNPSCLLL